MNILGTINGNYKSIGNPTEADCIIGQSFGAAENEPGYVNRLLARYILNKTSRELPLIVQDEIASALFEFERVPSLVIKGDPSTPTGGELDTWHVLEQARKYMNEYDLNHPIIVAQAYHVGRVCLQAMKQGMDPIIDEGLPDKFDPESTQFWTRNKYLWIPREIIGMTYLRSKDRL